MPSLINYCELRIIVVQALDSLDGYNPHGLHMMMMMMMILRKIIIIIIIIARLNQIESKASPYSIFLHSHMYN